MKTFRIGSKRIGLAKIGPVWHLHVLGLNLFGIGRKIGVGLGFE